MFEASQDREFPDITSVPIYMQRDSYMCVCSVGFTFPYLGPIL